MGPSSSPLGRLWEPGRSDTFQVNHTKFCEQDHNKEAEVEGKHAETVGFAELEALQRDGDQRDDEAEPQGAGQHPYQQSI